MMLTIWLPSSVLLGNVEGSGDSGADLKIKFTCLSIWHLIQSSTFTNEIDKREHWAVTQTIDVDVSRFGGGVDPEHEGDGEKREDDEADRSNQDARHDACHHAVRRVDLRVIW